MDLDALDPALHHFIARYIGSVEQLEILSLLSESPDKSWSAREVLSVIQSSEASVLHCLQSFFGQGFLKLQEDDGYRYAPQSPEFARAVSALCQTYRKRRVAVIEMIYRKPPDTIQDFADAFKLRKDK